MALADCEDGLLARILGHAEASDWLRLRRASRWGLLAVRRFLARLSELRLVGREGLALALLGPGQVTHLSCEALTEDPLPGLTGWWRLETLRLQDCDITRTSNKGK